MEEWERRVGAVAQLAWPHHSILVRCVLCASNVLLAKRNNDPVLKELKKIKSTL